MATRRSDNPLDTYLLRVFCLLVTERSVSRTAFKMNQSQPAISAALRRLRDIIGDPLLVREKGGMVPTERAMTLLAHAKGALAEIDCMVNTEENFDPQISRSEFNIGSPDYLAPVFISAVVERLRREAPEATLNLHSLDSNFDFERSLAEGELDVVIGNWPEPPDRMHLSVLLEDEIVCLMSANHPLVRKGVMTQEDYLNARHIVPMPYSLNQRGVIDITLSALRIRRQESISVKSFALAPYLLQGTDLVFTTTRHFADFYKKLLPLKTMEIPLEFPTMRFYQLWHERNRHSPSHRWLRRLLTECGAELAPNKGEPPTPT